MERLFTEKIVAVLISGLLLALPAIPVYAGDAAVEERAAIAAIEPGASADSATAEPEGVEGFAAYYAKRYNGRRTNSGQRHDPNKLTAAHPTLPHGTKVKVINLANDKEVVVTVNDRCRQRKQPFIDLSRAAAKVLGFLGQGKARVRIIPLEES